MLVKRFWAAMDERGLIYRMLDSQGATHWQARWDATGWQTLIGTPQPEMWVPFGLQEQLLIARTRVYVITSSTYQEGTEAYASGTGGTWVRPPIVLNQRRALDPLLGAFLQADGSDHLGRMDPEAYAYGPVISRCSRMSLVILEDFGCDTCPFLGVRGGSERVFLARVGLFRNASRRTCRARSIKVAANLGVLMVEKMRHSGSGMAIIMPL